MLIPVSSESPSSLSTNSEKHYTSESMDISADSLRPTSTSFPSRRSSSIPSNEASSVPTKIPSEYPSQTPSIELSVIPSTDFSNLPSSGPSKNSKLTSSQPSEIDSWAKRNETHNSEGPFAKNLKYNSLDHNIVMTMSFMNTDLMILFDQTTMEEIIKFFLEKSLSFAENFVKSITTKIDPYSISYPIVAESVILRFSFSYTIKFVDSLKIKLLFAKRIKNAVIKSFVDHHAQLSKLLAAFGIPVSKVTAEDSSLLDSQGRKNIVAFPTAISIFLLEESQKQDDINPNILISLPSVGPSFDTTDQPSSIPDPREKKSYSIKFYERNIIVTILLENIDAKAMFDQLTIEYILQFFFRDFC